MVLYSCYTFVRIFNTASNNLLCLEILLPTSPDLRSIRELSVSPFLRSQIQVQHNYILSFEDLFYCALMSEKFVVCDLHYVNLKLFCHRIVITHIFICQATSVGVVELSVQTIVIGTRELGIQLQHCTYKMMSIIVNNVNFKLYKCANFAFQKVIIFQ